MLVKKELREALPWATLAFFVIIILGLLQHLVMIDSDWYWELRYRYENNIRDSDLFKYNQFATTTLIIAITAIPLGLILGFCQFWLPYINGTWAFTLHRSVQREAILWSKIISSLIIFAISCLCPWLFLYYLSLNIPLPPLFLIFLSGVEFILLGIIAYFSIAICVTNNFKWYTTKFFVLLFSIIIILTCYSYNLQHDTFLVIIISLILFLTFKLMYQFKICEFK